MEKRLQRLTTKQLVELAARLMKRCHRLMTDDGSTALNLYGWDWSTFAVFYPRLYRIRNAYINEWRRRIGR